jgi:hypothetical protein
LQSVKAAVRLANPKLPDKLDNLVYEVVNVTRCSKLEVEKCHETLGALQTVKASFQIAKSFLGAQAGPKSQKQSVKAAVKLAKAEIAWRIRQSSLRGSKSDTL